MTDVARILTVQAGLHSSAADFSSTPGTTYRLDCNEVDAFPRSRASLARELYSTDNRRFAGVWGLKDIGAVKLGMNFCGVSSNTGAGIIPLERLEQASLLNSIFGATSATITGSAPTLSAVSTPGITVSSTVIATGDMIMFNTSTGWHCREVVSGGGSTSLTLDRAFTGTAVASSTVYRSARWNLATATTHHTHLYLSVEGENWRRDFFGLGPEGFDLAMAEGQLVDFSSSWLPTDVTDVAEANPSYSAPTKGSPIVVADAPLYIGDTEFLVRNLKVSLKNTLAPRVATTGPNGVHGYVVERKHEVMVSGELYIGDNSNTLGELVDGSGTPSLNDLTGSGTSTVAGTVKSTYDLGLQVGSAASGAMYIRIPAADIEAKVKRNGAFPVLEFSAFASAPSSGSAFRLGVF